MKRRVDWLIAAAIFAVVLGVTLAATPSEGINRDEAYYMKAGEQYITYWEHTLTGQAHLRSPIRRSRSTGSTTTSTRRS